jgi:Spy/CpxP family protein refolding chaperone
MLKKIAVLATIILMSTPAFVAAGEQGQGRPTPEERLSRMQKHLDLNDEQVSKIREIHDNGGRREEIGAVLTEEQREKFAKHRGPKDRLKRMQKLLDLSEEQMSQMREIHRNGGSREDVKTVLTQEQYNKAKEHRKQREHRRGSVEGSTPETSD